MRRSRVDSNHGDVVYALRAVGCSVLSIAPLRKGGDLLCAISRTRTVIFEVKDGAKPPSARKLTEDEQSFRESWKGEWHVVNSVDEALAIVRQG